MSAAFRLAFRVAFALLAGSLLYAHVRLIYSGNGNVLYWSSPSKVSIVINSDGSDDIDDGSHFTAIRNAIDAWNEVPGSTAKLKEDKSGNEQSSRNWESDSRHLVLFDEDNSSGYFPGSSGVVAITPLTFYLSGEIIDADILFNGKNFQFTTSGAPGRFDVQDVAAHELGHLLGLDHTGCAGGTMYPYVDPSVILHRSLSADEVRGMQHMYGSGVSKVKGTVRRLSDGSIVRGAWVGARDDDGRLAGTALTNDNGRFALQGLPDGDYTVYATPLDDPVSSGNLTNGHTVEVDFQSTVLGLATATAGSTNELGDLYVEANTSLGLGRVADDYPQRLVLGSSTVHTIRGSGLIAGSTLEVSDPDIALTSITWGSASVTFTANVGGLESLGHVDLTVTDPFGDRSILCGGLEITPPDPTVASVGPAIVDASGGSTLAISGTGFRAGLRVVIGDRVYVEGQGVTLLGSSDLSLELLPTVPGEHDVVVIDESGVEGRLVDGLQATATPVVGQVFPEAGASAGGTELTLLGDNFVAGSTVTIGGVTQSNVTVEGLDRITVVTEPGAPGGPYTLTVESPTGDVATAAFLYAPDPDPDVTSVDPGHGKAAGGQTVLVHGANFTPDTEVWFGVGKYAGQGGTKAKKVTFVDAGTLQVVTPEKKSSKKTVMVRRTSTQQATILQDGFAYTGEVSEGESGGGCAAIVPVGPDRWRDVLSGAGWIGALVLLLGLRRQRGSAPRRAPVCA